MSWAQLNNLPEACYPPVRFTPRPPPNYFGPNQKAIYQLLSQNDTVVIPAGSNICKFEGKGLPSFELDSEGNLSEATHATYEGVHHSCYNKFKKDGCLFLVKGFKGFEGF